MKWQVTKEESGLMLREYLKEKKGFSRRIVKAIKFQSGSLLVNDVAATVRKVLQAGDTVEVIFPKEHRAASMEAEPVRLDIVYEDNDILLINKMAGMATIPSIHHTKGTLANGILYHYEKNKLDFTVHIVTRLDRDTSGLLLVAKHRLSHSILAKDQQQGKIERRYQAIVSGHLLEKQATIEAPIARNPNSIIERMVDPSGKQSITHYQVLEETATDSLVQITLETGRTHQIRVHFSHLGHPLVGDELYGGKTDMIPRQALHCVSLSFIHPITKEKHMFTSNLPADMQKILPAK
ncbi:RluA family pseudouridine synthase [Paraliobacillus sp. JSM ZJ581]|uniref:RluA family pseudouridine synthase n=1 Tax=Paraliobacillus sp. JSM ZJ581 TaxID=3342118 RepID=UPI0035A8605B